MGIITRMLIQDAIYWAPSGVDSRGQPTWALPKEIRVRWEDVTQEFIDDDGDVQMSRALIYVSEDVEVAGVLFLGQLLNTIDQTDPKANAGAWEIRRYEKLPKLNGREFLRTVFV